MEHLIERKGVDHGFGCCRAHDKHHMIRALFQSFGWQVTEGSRGIRLTLKPGQLLTLQMLICLRHITPYVGRGSRFLGFRNDRLMLCEFRGSHMLLCWTDPTRAHSTPFSVRWDRLGCTFPMQVSLGSPVKEPTPIHKDKVIPDA